MRQVSAPILTATVAMLSPYCPDLTASRLVEALDRPGIERPAPLPESLTKADVVRAGKVSLQTVNRWIATGKLRAVKVGRCGFPAPPSRPCCSPPIPASRWSDHGHDHDRPHCLLPPLRPRERDEVPAAQ
jgi:hypothetical protein